MRHITLISCLITLSALAGPHTLQRGESFEDIARLYNVPLDSLKKCNPDIEEYVGYTIDIPIDNHFYDLGESDLFRKLKYNGGSQKEKGIKKYKAAFEKQTNLYKVSPDKKEKFQREIQKEYEEAVECGNLDALYQLGRRYVHGTFYSHNHIPDFRLEINQNIEEFSRGIEYMQIAGLLSGNAKAYIDMAVACGHENSPIRNPYLCVSMLEVFADSKDWPVRKLICYMYENGYGIKKNLMQAYVYCSDTELVGSNGHSSKREKLLKQIDELPKSQENSFYGNDLDPSTMMALGLSFYNDDKVSPQGIYWIHKAALKNDADANWTLAGILKNGNYIPGSVGSQYDINRQVMTFVENAANFGNKDATEYLIAYKEQEAEKERQRRIIAEKDRQREAEKKARRQQMWANIAGAVLQSAAQAVGQIEYAKQMSRTGTSSFSNNPSINGLSENQWLAKNRLAMEQILQYTVNKSIADWNGTPMVPTDMSAVNFGTDMSPGSPLWSWNMQQRINTISTRSARMQCETLAFYRRQTDMIEQQFRENPYQPIAGYVNSDGYWISADMVGNPVPDSDNSGTGHNGHEAIKGKNSAYFKERYGNKDCHSCHGSGRCTTCNGTGYVSNNLTSGSSECPNCFLENMRRSGKCRTCQGRGTVYGLK
ncbi:MAG: hypothetical protein K2N09_06740 [Muribaculaceae bacterium]|nr:hypothetical protein [Muribaculaceae bacterium]